jgi:penicillin-binding protein 2
MNDVSFGSPFRKSLLYYIIVGFVIFVIFQLFQMQVLEHVSYQEKSQDNSIKRVIQNAPRGIFFDRNLKVLLSNKPTFTVQVTPDKYDNNLNGLLETVLEVDGILLGTMVLKKHTRNI